MRPENRRPLETLTGWALLAYPSYCLAKILLAGRAASFVAANAIPQLPLIAAGLLLVRGARRARALAFTALGFACAYGAFAWLLGKVATGELLRAVLSNAFVGALLAIRRIPRAGDLRSGDGARPIDFPKRGWSGRIITSSARGLTVKWDGGVGQAISSGRLLEVQLEPGRWVACRWSSRDSRGFDR